MKQTVMRTVQNAPRLSVTASERAVSRVFTTATLVTGLSIIERALGFLYRIVLSRLIGAEGLGIYQVALSLFSVFLTLGTGGIPLTVSRLIAKSRAERDQKGARSAFTAGVSLSLALTLPVCIFFVFFGERFTFLFSDARCLPVFRVLLIGLVFSSLYAVVRGGFWGEKEFLTPSVLELAEESVMVLVGVLLLQNVTTPLSGATNAAWAAVISYLFSFTVSSVCFLARGGRLSSPTKQFKSTFVSTLPITSVRLIATLVNSCIAILFPAMLVRAGYTDSESLTLLGVVTGMALPILMIPATVIGSLSLVLIPELSEDYYGKNNARLYKNIERGIRVALLVAFFLLPFFYALGEDLGKIAFSNALAGEIISKSCPLLVPMSLSMITTSILNSLGFEKHTFVYYFIGAAAMFACIFLLPSVCGAYAYVLGLGASFLITAVCNLCLLFQKCRGLFPTYGKTLLSTLARATLALLPLSLLGKLFSVFFKYIFGELIATFATGFVLLLFTFITWQIFKLLSVSSLVRAVKSKKNKKTQKN